MAGLTTSTNAETLASLAATLTHIFRPGFVRSLNDEIGLWNLLPHRRAAGPLLELKFHYARNTGVGATTESGSVGTAVAQSYLSGNADFAIYTAPIEITDLSQAKSLVGGHSNWRAWSDEVARSAIDLRQQIEVDLWTAQTGNACLGVPDYVDDGSTANSIFGHDRDDYPFLSSMIADGGDAAISFAKLRELARIMRHGTGADIAGNTANFLAEDQGGGRADVHFTTPEIEAAYEALVTANNRYPLPPVGGNTGLDPGQTNLRYKNAPVIGSRFCADNTWYALDRRYWWIEVLPQALITADGERVETDFALVLEGKSGQSVSAFWRIYLQLACEQPNKQGKIKSVSHDEPS